MNKGKQAESHTSKVLVDLLKEITPQEQARIDKRMMLAAKIDDAIKAKGWTYKKFGDKIGQLPSVVSKWLSGSHNFTSDTLSDIEYVLGIELLALKEPEWKMAKVGEYIGMAVAEASPSVSYIQPFDRYRFTSFCIADIPESKILKHV